MASYDGWDDFPDEILEDQMFVDFLDSFFQKGLTGDNWHGIHDALEDYMWEEYGLIFDDYIDWDDYGEWYEG